MPISVRLQLLALIGAATLAWLAPESAPSRRPPDVRRGLALLQHFNDSLPANGGNALRCTSCHLDDGRRGSAMSWVGATTRYPKYRARRGGVETIEQRVNECVTRSLAGRTLPEDGDDMRDIVAYLDESRRQAPPGRPDTVRLAGDTLRGSHAYRTHCARCHASDGSGGSAPAVNGAMSFSIGAGMSRQTVLATFLRWNMPQDQPGILGEQAAADIAAYVLRRPRPDHPGKERDWPQGNTPADLAYVTESARRLRVPLPAPRPVLRRRVAPQPRTPDAP
ncbi:MAG TPA: c-type cytochrome [Gemmatimonadaceae bacterium]|nr:c-type cytochrome [Gemmatimonadaceae bacterium]